MKSCFKYVVAFVLAITSTVAYAQESRAYLDKEFLMPLMRMDPIPGSGKVEVNSPWFQWAPVVKEKKGDNTFMFDSQYRYQARLSQDVDFNDSTTLTSSVKEWTLFNPHKKLAKGQWYWQYSSIHKQSGEQHWSEPISFEITGDERFFVIPDFEELKQNIGDEHPRIYCSPQQIGTFDLSLPGLTKSIEKCEGMISKSLPKTLVYDNKKVLDEKRAKLKPKDYQRFLGKRTKEKYRAQARQFDLLIKAWLLTGDERYKKEVRRRYNYLKEQYALVLEAGAYNDFTEGFYINVSTQMFDVFYDELSDSDRTEIMDFLIEKQEHSFHHIIHRGELFAIDNHLWQHHFRNFFFTSLALVNHTPKADKWLQYVYEVWSMRAPVGSRNDGGWVPDNGYFDANKESLISFPVILSRLTGVDYFQQPWYQNSPKYLFYTSPIGHVAGGFGDLADVKRQNAVDFVRALTSITNDSYGHLYSDLARGNNKTNKRTPFDLLSLSEDGNLFWFAMQALNEAEGVDKVNPKRAACFPDVGMVSMNSDVLNANNNLMLSFRSSPYGLTGHAHACQNAFNIQYGGEPLFFKTGYYSSFIDPHSTLSYRHTRAHNSILADGIGQTMTPSSYGWIARFATGENYSYTLGDASNAYSGQLLRDYFKEQFKKWGIEVSKENGFGDPGVTTFRRHVSMLGENLIVIYDELQALDEVTWSWLLNGKNEITIKDQSFYTENKEGKGLCHLFSSESIQFAVRDTFFAAADDWLGNGAKRGIEFKNQYHAVGKTAKAAKVRFLALIQVSNKTLVFKKVKPKKDGSIHVDGWTIKAELNPEKSPALHIQDGSSVCISIGDEKLDFGGKEYVRKFKGSSLIIETLNNKTIVKELVDSLPDAALYY